MADPREDDEELDKFEPGDEADAGAEPEAEEPEEEPEDPVLERMKQLEAQNASQAEILKRLHESNKALVDETKAITKRYADAEVSAVTRTKQRLEAEMEAAVAESDTEKFKAAKAQYDALAARPQPAEAKPAEPAPAAPAAPPPELQAEVRAWVGRNAWFRDGEQEIRDAADVIHKRLIKKEPHLTLKQNLDKVTEEMRQRFPEAFENERRRAPSGAGRPTGDRAGARQARVNGHTFSDLPKADQASYESLRKMMKATRGVDYTKEEYLADYEWDAR